MSMTMVSELWRWALGASIGAVGLVLSCTTADERGGGAEGFQTMSLFGDSLFANQDSASAIARADSVLAANRNDIDAAIQAGRERRNAWRYREAIELYDRATEIDPEDWRPYRFRGHRRLSLREFDQGIRDLEEARARAFHNFDVAYHLGLAYYLAGRYDEAADEYLRCLLLAYDPDAIAYGESGELPADYRTCMSNRDVQSSLVAMSSWAYNALVRAGRMSEAEAVVVPIEPGWEMDVNQAYYLTLLSHKGLVDDDEILGEAGESLGRFETRAYGIAVRHLAEGDTVAARELLENIAAHPHWPGFGRIAAEVDLALRLP